MKFKILQNSYFEMNNRKFKILERVFCAGVTCEYRFIEIFKEPINTEIIIRDANFIHDLVKKNVIILK